MPMHISPETYRYFRDWLELSKGQGLVTWLSSVITLAPAQKIFSLHPDGPERAVLVCRADVLSWFQGFPFARAYVDYKGVVSIETEAFGAGRASFNPLTFRFDSGNPSLASRLGGEKVLRIHRGNVEDGFLIARSIRPVVEMPMGKVPAGFKTPITTKR